MNESDGLQRFQLDRAAQTALTTLFTAHDFTVQALVKLVRGQTSSDYPPNKALCPLRLAALLHGYKHCQLVCSVASREIAPHIATWLPLPERIEYLAKLHPGQVIRILKGDVKTAFRHLMLESSTPSYYGAFGGAISWLLARESPATMTGGACSDVVPFFGYVWVDDHVLVEPDT
ncbi:hypothetical protein JG688_00015079, partial [Phytophthora aleatoria]